MAGLNTSKLESLHVPARRIFIPGSEFLSSRNFGLSQLVTFLLCVKRSKKLGVI